jgi:hypothetical protein
MRSRWSINLAVIALVLSAVAGFSLFRESSVTPAWASKTISLRNSIAGTGCEDDEYLFIINQLDKSSDAPASIQVQLSCGGEITVALSALHNKNAHYSLSPSNLPGGCTPVGATAVIYDSYHGNFVISHVPCGSPSPSPEPSPSPSPAM